MPSAQSPVPPPTVSILMPNRNRGRFIEQAIASVLNQTYRDFELIVWDDGSTDESLAIARRIQMRSGSADPRLRIFEGEPRGIAAALKSAHEQARGGFIGWVDSDDLLGKTAIADTMTLLANRPDVGVVYTGFVVIDEDSKVKGVGTRCRIPYSPERLLIDFMTFHFRLFRRSVFEAAGGVDVGYSTSPDYDFCLRASEVTAFAHLPKNLYGYRVHPGSISESRRTEQRENSARMVRAALERRGLADRLALRVDEAGKFHIEPVAGAGAAPGPGAIADAGPPGGENPA